MSSLLTRHLTDKQMFSLVKKRMKGWCPLCWWCFTGCHTCSCWTEPVLQKTHWIQFRRHRSTQPEKTPHRLRIIELVFFNSTRQRMTGFQRKMDILITCITSVLKLFFRLIQEVISCIAVEIRWKLKLTNHPDATFRCPSLTFSFIPPVLLDKSKEVDKFNVCLDMQTIFTTFHLALQYRYLCFSSLFLFEFCF